MYNWKKAIIKLLSLKQDSNTITCPYCNYQTNDLEKLHDHLTYYEWMSVPSVDKTIKEIKGKKCIGIK